MQTRADDSGLGRRLQNHGTGAVREQHAGPTIVPIDDARQGLRSNDQRAFRFAEANELVGDAEGVNETGACGLQAESGTAVMDAESILQQRPHIGEHLIRRRRPDANEIDVGRGDSRRHHGATRGVFRQIGRGLALRGHVPARYSGARAYPFIARVDQPLEVRVGHYLLGQVAARTGDA